MCIMSKVFFDHLVNIDSLAVVIKENVETAEEREELWNLVDEIIHHQVMGCIFDYLPQAHHAEFVEKLAEAPYDESLISYLNGKIKTNIEEQIQYEVQKIIDEIIQELLQE